MSDPDFTTEATALIGKSFDLAACSRLLEVWYLRGKISANLEHMAVPRFTIPQRKEEQMAKKKVKKAKKKAIK